jgi:hypothetical protein
MVPVKISGKTPPARNVDPGMGDTAHGSTTLSARIVGMSMPNPMPPFHFLRKLKNPSPHLIKNQSCVV